MRGSELRQLFLDFFVSKGHKILPSASLIPAQDPSILWTAAGMVPFKPFFTGAATPEHRRVTTCQKCLRMPDIEMVGRTARHHTFFEMLGNFSFGDYFKDEAIDWAWEFSTGKLGLDPARLWISVYTDDDEAFDIWTRIGVTPDRIVRLGKDTNFWEIGVGPCGPCSEIYYDLGPERGCDDPECAVGCECDRYLEIWNLVFIQFFRNEEGEYSPLEKKGIDTGMGLERVSAVLQGVESNFDTDLFREIIDATARILGVTYGADRDTDIALKVIADHARATTFAIGDGALPSNEGRGYVVRRLLRRAIRYGLLLGKEEQFLDQVSEAVVQQMSDAYPNLERLHDSIIKIVRTEEARFRKSLVQGTDILTSLIAAARAKGETVLSGLEAFRLYDTFGFPLELTREICAEQNLGIDEKEFEQAMQEQRQRARQARRETEYISEHDAFFRDLRDELGETVFVGYEVMRTQAVVLAIVQDGQRLSRAGAGSEVDVVLNVTPGYAEAGGQVSDRGRISGDGSLRARIGQVQSPVENLIVHRVLIENGTLEESAVVEVDIDSDRRTDTCRNHTATHLLHKALRTVLGDHVNQAGSLVAPERLRFDFTHYQAVSADELDRVERLVNSVILDAVPVQVEKGTYEEAVNSGVTALFGEKYGDEVRVVRIGEFSAELCGGTHLFNTAQAGIFHIASESSVASGIRRIEAVTGNRAFELLRESGRQIGELARILKAPPRDVVSKVKTLFDDLREAGREIEALKDRLRATEIKDLLDRAENLDGVRLLAARVRAGDIAEMRGLMDLLRDHLGSSVIILGAITGDKVSLLVAVSKDLIQRGLHAGHLVKEAAGVVGGGGGGRPDLAQAGGKDASKLDQALEQARLKAIDQFR
ncbi:MAG: alanine--tRNA ligase [Desulforudis sp.]|nr:MAG: alanine--tRNA ligase [Desulforudis sp.]